MNNKAHLNGSSAGNNPVTYCRTDLCPNCSARLKNLHVKHDPRWDHITIGDYPIYGIHKGKMSVNVKCFNCYNVWTKDYVYEYWSTYMLEELE